MKDESITHPLYVQLQSDIDRVEKLQHKFRKSYYWFRGSQIALTGIITVLSGFETVDHHYILVFGAIVTALTAIETLFRFDTKKDSFSLALFDFRAIRDDFIFLNIQDNINQTTEREIFDRFVRAKSAHRRTISRDSPTMTGSSETN